MNNKIVFWRKNLFLLPSGACSKRYIEEITWLLNEWNSDSPLKDISKHIQSHDDNATFFAWKTLKNLSIKKASTVFWKTPRSMEKRWIWKATSWGWSHSETLKKRSKTIRNCWNIKKVQTVLAERQHQRNVKFIHSVRFESINEELIRRPAINTKGDSGLSGMDVDGWRRIIPWNSFGTANIDLRKVFANLVKKLYQI